MLIVLKGANLALRFGLELAALAAFGLGGYRLGGASFWRFILVFGAPLAAAVLWGLFASPRGAARLADPGRLIFEAAFFGVAVMSLALAGYPTPAWALGLAVLANELLLALWGQRHSSNPFGQ